MFDNYSDVVTIKEFSKMLDIGTVLAYKLVKEKAIPTRKIGREYKILKVDVIKYLTDFVIAEDNK